MALPEVSVAALWGKAAELLLGVSAVPFAPRPAGRAAAVFLGFSRAVPEVFKVAFWLVLGFLGGF